MEAIDSSVNVIFFDPRGMTTEGLIEQVGRVSHKSEDKITEDSAGPFIEMIKKLGHDAVLEFGWAVAHVIADRGLCYDDQTEVLTDEGWKLFKNTTDNDLFLTVDPDTKKTEYQKRINYTEEDWDDDLIYGSSTMVDFAVTPNHRMFWYHYDSRVNRYWKINKAEEIYGRRVKFKRGLFEPVKGKIYKEQTFGGNSPSDFAKFMGLFITDGSLWQGKNDSGVKLTGGRVILTQVKPQGRMYIEKVLNSLSWDWSWSENSKQYRVSNTKLYNFLRKYFPENEYKSLQKRVPCWIRHANVEYINAFLEGVIVGDGNIHKKNKHVVVYTGSSGFAGDLQELFLKVGKCASVRIDNRIGQKHTIKTGQTIEHKVVSYIVSVTSRTNDHLFNKKHWSKKHYKGKVYCVTVPNGTLYVRRNGKSFWSGNTHELVRHRIASYLQESTRYCNYSKGKWSNQITVINQPGVKDEDREYWLEGMAKAEEYYFGMLDRGYKPDVARSLLPIGVKTEIYIGANTREWRHIFNMRCSKKAHPIIRGISRQILTEFVKEMPSLYADQADKFLDLPEGYLETP